MHDGVAGGRVEELAAHDIEPVGEVDLELGEQLEELVISRRNGPPSMRGKIPQSQ